MSATPKRWSRSVYIEYPTLAAALEGLATIAEQAPAAYQVQGLFDLSHFDGYRCGDFVPGETHGTVEVYFVVLLDHDWITDEGHAQEEAFIAVSGGTHTGS